MSVAATLRLQLEGSLNGLLRNFADEVAEQFEGLPAQLEAVAADIRKTFGQGSAPQTTDIQTAIERFALDQIDPDDSYLYGLVGFGLHKPCAALNGDNLVMRPDKLDFIINYYDKELQDNDLWEMSWFGVLQSYFSLTEEISPHMRETIRQFLSTSWPKVSSCLGYQPVWAVTLAQNTHMLEPLPSQHYAAAWLGGDDASLNRLKADLQISGESWFWRELTGSAMSYAYALDDDAFKKLIPRLLELAQLNVKLTDECLAGILGRYHACSDRSLHQALKDACIDRWRNPRHRDLGGSYWSLIPQLVWQMAVTWTNEANLRLFFESLAARSGSDKGRLKFWLQYIEQVKTTRLIFGQETCRRKDSTRQLRKLFEDGDFAKLDSGNDELDAFIMEIGNYTIVEFSLQGNGCYVYKTGSQTFKLDQMRYSSGTEKAGLKESYYLKNGKMIVHRPDWEIKVAPPILEPLGIYPDRKRARAIHSALNPANSILAANFRREAGMLAMEQHCTIEDLIDKGGAYWVNYDRAYGGIAERLKKIGFQYKAGRGWWNK